MNKKSTSDIKREHENLGDFYFKHLFEGMDELSETHDEKLKKNRIQNIDVELFPVGFEPYNDIWRYEPVDSRYFYKHFIPEPPTPKQQEFLDIVCGVDPFSFSDLSYDEADLMWGKGSGKDATSAKALTYQNYKLCCLTNPQKFLGLGLGSPIDMVNVASTSDQAKKIFFKYLTAFIKMCKDPDTGHNWFASRNFWYDIGKQKFVYMDLREKDGQIKQGFVEFGREIACHSLTSERFTAEGMTIVLAIMDELGAMRPEKVFGNKTGEDNKMIGQHKSLGTSIRRSSKFGKLVCISYKYSSNCPMSILIRKHKNDPRKFVRVYSTYEVRTDKPEAELRAQFASDYKDDPELAKMMYECKDPLIESDKLFSNIYIINGAVDTVAKHTVNPFKKKIIVCDDISQGMNLLEPWFRGDEKFYYAVHADLAKGQVWKNGDAIGLSMGHLEEMRVHYDKAWVEYYMKHYQVDLSEFQGQLRIGVVMDFILQIVCTREQKEVRLADVRKFVTDLQDERNFGLIKVTYDRWGSEETIQEMDRHGIECGLLSMDKTKGAFHTMKDYMQQGIWKTYPHQIFQRECEELTDTGTKIDHPKLSVSRFENEGYELGSKDCVDSAAGVTQTLVKELVDGGGVIFG